ncbi:hypothetical protein DXC89_02505 [Prevotella disiens]|uniref:Uncharacterized protein n=1 Tax=Prevotella disiens TaxID=28130 RepID=A0A3E4QM70_9BACT|nr:hypothetical protein DXC89_02505 [Prevotella disiens]
MTVRTNCLWCFCCVYNFHNLWFLFVFGFFFIAFVFLFYCFCFSFLSPRFVLNHCAVGFHGKVNNKL